MTGSKKAKDTTHFK